MDGVLKKGGQENRTKIEQDYIENMIRKIYDEYRSKLTENETSEEDQFEDVEDGEVTHYLLKDFHGQYLYFNLHNVGIVNYDLRLIE